MHSALHCRSAVVECSECYYQHIFERLSGLPSAQMYYGFSLLSIQNVILFIVVKVRSDKLTPLSYNPRTIVKQIFINKVITNTKVGQRFFFALRHTSPQPHLPHSSSQLSPLHHCPQPQPQYPQY